MAEKQADHEVAPRLEEEKQRHQKEVRGRLDQADERIRTRLRQASNKAHESALRIKASRLGRVVTDQEETTETGDKKLTLEIELA